MERAGIFRLGGAAAFALAAAAAGLLVWLGLGDRDEPVAARPAPTPSPVRPAAPARNLLLSYRECPAKCLVEVLEEDRPEASVGAWCNPRAPEHYVCISVVDDPEDGVYECRSWLVRTDRRAGIELLRTAQTGCPPRRQTPAAGSEAR